MDMKLYSALVKNEKIVAFSESVGPPNEVGMFWDDDYYCRVFANNENEANLKQNDLLMSAAWSLETNGLMSRPIFYRCKRYNDELTGAAQFAASKRGTSDVERFVIWRLYSY